MNGDCNICINGKLPSYSASCVECGLLRKNYKPMTNADRIRGMTDEELAQFFHDCVACNDCPVGDSKCKRAFALCKNTALSWLQSPVEEG